MKSKTKWLTAICTLAVVFVLVLSLGLSSIFASAADEVSTGSADPARFYSDYDTKEEADEAVGEMNLSLEEEGIVLLKNDGSLPLSTHSRVSVFGIGQDTLVESEGSIAESLENAGFTVNPTLKSYYENDGAVYANFGNEPELEAREKSSISSYNDVGFVVINRGDAGEAAIQAEGTGEKEDEKYLGVEQGWEHEDLPTLYETDDTDPDDIKTVPYSSKHELELTDSEEDMLALAEQTCKKVVVLYAGEQVFEMWNMQNDPKVNGILWVGRPGYGGVDAIGEALCGDVNPSGKTVDEWTRDLTNDPTYANVSSTDYVYTDTVGDENVYRLFTGNSGDIDPNYNGLDYEEDIYYGYKFYETYWKEGGLGENLKSKAESADAWYSANVLYPLGYGLSYTSFSYDLQSVKTNRGGDVTTGMSADDFSTSEGDVSKNESSSKIVSMTASVKVTNTGLVAGKEVVEIYVEAPYGKSVTGHESDSTVTGIEKPYYTLVGFGKTSELNPGASETLDITFNVQDFASYDYSDANTDNHKGYELDLGSYNIHVMESSSHTNIEDEGTTANKTNAYECCAFSIVAGSTYQSAAHLDADDWSGNAIENLFSTTDETDGQSDFYSMSMSAASGTMTSPLDTGTSTMLSRSNLDNTWPTATADFSGDVYIEYDDEGVALETWASEPKAVSIGDATKAESLRTGLIEKYDDIYADDYDDTGMPWEKTIADLAGWTQGAGVIQEETGMYEITLDMMSGVPLYDSDGNVTEAWVEFMNQLTWEEVCSILNDAYHMTVSIPSIGKVETKDENGPNKVPSGKDLVGTPMRCATWNQDLLYQSGVVAGDSALMNGDTGYYGPGVNTHRSPFGGRTAEYFSQDGILAGYMASAFCSGMSSRGIMIYVKHFAMNDYGLPSNSTNLCANVSEQNMRENYLKPFQMCMQEGECRGAMTSLGRIGGVWCGQNYALQQQLAKDEWGWDGCFITDTIAMLKNMTVDGLIRTGGNLPDGNFHDEGNEYGLASGDWVDGYDWTDDLVTAGYVDKDDLANIGKTDSSGEEITLESLAGFALPVGAVTLTKTVTDETTKATSTVAYASPTQWYCARTAAMQVLYNTANSAANYNGISSSQMASQDIPANVQQGLEASRTVVDDMGGIDQDGNVVEVGFESTVAGVYIVADDLVDRVSVSEITDGTLPNGMYIEAGVLYGKALESGEFTVTVTSYVDSWIPLTSVVKIKVAESIYMSRDISQMTVNEATRSAEIVHDDDVFDINTEWIFQYEITDGRLPNGVTMDENGRFEGTPTETGTFTFTVSISVTDANGWRLILDSDGQFAWDSLITYDWFYIPEEQEGGANFLDDEGNLKTAEFCIWILNGGSWNGMPFSKYMANSVYPPEAEIYTMTYTITVSEAADGAGTGSESSSGAGSGMAIAALVLAIVAIVAAAAVCVIVLLKRNGNGGSSGNSGDGADGDRPVVD